MSEYLIQLSNEAAVAVHPKPMVAGERVLVRMDRNQRFYSRLSPLDVGSYPSEAHGGRVGGSWRGWIGTDTFISYHGSGDAIPLPSLFQ